MSVRGSAAQIWRTIPSIVLRIISGAVPPSLTANSTKTKSGLPRSTSFPQRNTPRSLPVPPMAALISETSAFGKRSFNHLSVPTRHPLAAVIDPPKYATLVGFPSRSFPKTLPKPSRVCTSVAEWSSFANATGRNASPYKPKTNIVAKIRNMATGSKKLLNIGSTIRPSYRRRTSEGVPCACDTTSC
ncbi:MAG: hypothetical protein QM811_31840 [Pirellulales bacterium]